MLPNPSPESPEARRKRLVRARARFGRFRDHMRPGAYTFEVVKRVALGVYADGFIHAGNLAYLALLALFPFFIVTAALANLFGQSESSRKTVVTVLAQLPPTVADVLRQPIAEVLSARNG